MIEVILTYPTPEGSQEIIIEGDKMSFGRGSEADQRFEDDGLSRLHSTIYVDGDHVWIVDENSTNGTFVNGQKVEASGTPLQNGDAIKIGHYTNLNVRIAKEQSASSTSSYGSNPTTNTTSSVSSQTVQSTSYLIPLLIMGFAVFVIGVSAIFIGVNVLGGDDSKEYVKDSGSKHKSKSKNEKEEKEEKTPEDSTTPKPEEPGGNNVETPTIDSPNDPKQQEPELNLPAGKTYQSMSDDEKRLYIKSKSQRIARMIGNRSSDSIPPEAVERIKSDVDGYARRVNAKSRSTCGFGGNLQETYERASKNAPFIIKDFYSQEMAPEIGLYLAMIESEHCPCLESPTHALGLFQFLASTAPDFGLAPKDRCNVELSSKAAAKYMKMLSGRFGTGPLSVPLAIASYNSGQGALSDNLSKTVKTTGNQEKTFWDLVANANNLREQFQKENIKYVPKFFAAAIIGENPQDFGLNLKPLSTYTK